MEFNPTPFNTDFDPLDASFITQDDITITPKTNTPDLNSQFNDIPLDIEFISILPINNSPKNIKFLLSEHNVNNWTSIIPTHIKPDSAISVTLKYKNNSKLSNITKQISLYNYKFFSQLFNVNNKELIPKSIDITIKFSLFLSTDNSIHTDNHLLDLEQSLGERPLLTKFLLNSNEPTIRRRPVPTPTPVPSPTRHRRTTTSTIGTFNPSDLLRSLINIGLDNSSLPSFEEQNNTLQAMGFTDVERNHRVLVGTLGNVQAAVNILVNASADDNSNSNID